MLNIIIITTVTSVFSHSESNDNFDKYRLTIELHSSTRAKVGGNSSSRLSAKKSTILCLEKY